MRLIRHRRPKSFRPAAAGPLLIACALGCAVERPLSAEQQAQLELSVQHLLSRATASLRSGSTEQLEEAYNALELARDLDAQDPRIIDGLGCVEWRKGNYRLAAHFFRKALLIDPEYDRAYAHLALYEEQAGNISEALALLRRAVQLNPLNYRSRSNYSALLLQIGRRAEAQKQFQRASAAMAGEHPPANH